MQYRKKPVVIEAVQWLATKASFEEILSMGNIKWSPGDMGSGTFFIKTLEGNHFVQKGDYIIKGVQGEFYSCKSDIFHETYESLKEKEKI
ncbi:MAG: hypothetical protein Q8P20_01025 [bacterium]|nr:hypothetical protein [bacterium]MDZ4228051.1 hypothetical protein [Candidatus Levybacteria bacterium]